MRLHLYTMQSTLGKRSRKMNYELARRLASKVTRYTVWYGLLWSEKVKKDIKDGIQLHEM
jgi:hypothetical protein